MRGTVVNTPGYYYAISYWLSALVMILVHGCGKKDVWKLENFGFEVRQNPIDVIRTIKFTGIIQETIREEVKTGILYPD